MHVAQLPILSRPLLKFLLYLYYDLLVMVIVIQVTNRVVRDEVTRLLVIQIRKDYDWSNRNPFVIG